ncbi:ABC-2 family transporter protein [Patescibacteria group bacterium]|nr:ABC-2 family transporter protein [Patescibacteria group bacterium]MBU1721330.1 ABC-2 family transporter protein [Patescibacteria group bacterium]MBU1901615.1 ABC-2 family transporter protein [Patescibacteria group bacterium]
MSIYGAGEQVGTYSLVGIVSYYIILTFLRMTVSNGLGIAIITYGIANQTIERPFMTLLFFLFTFTCGQIILYSITLSTKTINFKSIEGWSTNAIAWRFHNLARYPTDMYTDIVRIVYTFTFPLAFITTVSTKMLLGQISWPLLAIADILATISIIIARFIWNYAVNTYSSASS